MRSGPAVYAAAYIDPAVQTIHIRKGTNTMTEEEQNEYYLQRKEQLMAPIIQQILMTDDRNEVLLLAGVMVDRAYSIFRETYGRDAALRLINTIVELNDQREGLPFKPKE